MPVTTQRDEYQYMAKDIWPKCRDAAMGQKAIHERNEKYLPKLDKQTTAQYNAYKQRALFLAATSRTIDSMVGMVFRKPPTIDLPSPADSWLEDISASGVSIEQMAKECMTELMTVGRYGLLVDYPEVIQEDGPLTVAQVEENGLRPRLKKYVAENIINWKVETIGNKDVLTLVVLYEEELEPVDEFDTNNYVKRYRVLDFDESGNYRQRVYDEGGEVLEEYLPRMNGQAMNFLPFLIVGEDGVKADVTMPPLNDLADINVSHYQAYADYRHGLHYTGLPTPWMTGVTDEEESANGVIGPNAYWSAQNADAKFGYLEFEGKGLDQLAEELDNLKTDMANFGAKLLKEPKKTAEAAETAAINRSGESSLLASWASVVGASLNEAINIMLQWANISGECFCQLNKDYVPASMDSGLLKELTASVIAGKMSFEDYVWNLRNGELLPEDRTAEDAASMIETDDTMLGGEEDA